jgi:membrane protease YdiL (CAAX protease family)
VERTTGADSESGEEVGVVVLAGGRLGLFWRVVIVFLAVTLVWLVVVQGLGPFFGPAYSDRVGHIVRALLTSALVLPLIFLARRYLDRRSWEGLRLTSLRAGWRWLLFGMAFWLVAAGCGLVATLALGWVRISVSAPGTGILLLILYLPLLVFLYEALPEELVFRGYFYRNLSERFARWTAVLAQATLFTLWGPPSALLVRVTGSSSFSPLACSSVYFG